MNFVTLISDFGVTDYYVALLKAAIYSQNDDLTVVDITHHIQRHDIMEASFYLSSVYNHFPIGTVHVACVNTFYAGDSELIMFHHAGYSFIGPNNGLFSLVFPNLSETDVYKIDEPLDVSSQYDLVGFIVQQLLKKTPLSDIGPPVEYFDQKITLQPVITSSQIRATIVHVDQFGNVIVNLDKRTFEKVKLDREYAIYYKSNDPITRISLGYNEAQIGDVCAFFNTIGMLEIAVNMGNAHELLNLNRNETIQINFF